MSNKTTTIEPYAETEDGATHDCDAGPDFTDPPDLDDPVYDELHPGLGGPDVPALKRQLLESLDA